MTIRISYQVLDSYFGRFKFLDIFRFSLFWTFFYIYEEFMINNKFAIRCSLQTIYKKRWPKIRIIVDMLGDVCETN